MANVTTSCRDLNELNPYVKELAEEFLDKCARAGLKVVITETYRSPARQDYLYSQGRTIPGKIVTNATGKAKSSYHYWRLAFDVCQNVKGAAYDNAFFAKVGPIGESVGLEWGGRWTSPVDKPHFQYTFGLSISQLKNGAKIPGKTKEIKKEEYTVESLKMKINGAATNVSAINIDGSNFVKIRDLDSNNITVGYSDNMPTLSVSTKETAIVVDGEKKNVDAVNIDGFTYVKLRDIAGKNISVDYVDGKPEVKIN